MSRACVVNLDPGVAVRGDQRSRRIKHDVPDLVISAAARKDERPSQRGVIFADSRNARVVFFVQEIEDVVQDGILMENRAGAAAPHGTGRDGHFCTARGRR